MASTGTTSFEEFAREAPSVGQYSSYFSAQIDNCSLVKEHTYRTSVYPRVSESSSGRSFPRAWTAPRDGRRVYRDSGNGLLEVDGTRLADGDGDSRLRRWSSPISPLFSVLHPFTLTEHSNSE